MTSTRKIINLTSENFEQMISKRIAIVDFWAEWCSPCQIQLPILRELASETEDNIMVAKVNVDDNRSIAKKYGVSSIPTLLILKNGKIEKQFIGVQPKQALMNALKNLI